MTRNSGDFTPMPQGDDDDLSRLFRDESGAEEVVSVTDETLALLNSAFGPDAPGGDSFLSLSFFAFG